jgi:hypothetical protein
MAPFVKRNPPNTDDNLDSNGLFDMTSVFLVKKNIHNMETMNCALKLIKRT